MAKYKTSFIQGTAIKVPDTNVYTQLLHRSRLNASSLLAVCHEDKLTMNRLKKETECYAKAFLTLGVKKGDIVPFCLPPCNEGIIAFFALNRIGAVAAFLDSTAGKDEIVGYLRRFSASVFIASARHATRLPDIVQETKVSHIIVISAFDAFKKLSSPSTLTQELLRMDCALPKQKEIFSLHDFLLLGQENLSFSMGLGHENDPALISFTSGTTGDPKPIVLSNGNIVAEMISEKKSTLMQFGPQGKLLQTVPFNYPYGFLISTIFPMFVGKTVALTPLLKIATFCEYLRNYQPAYILGIPPLYTYMLHAKEFEKIDLCFLKYPISGGDKLEIAEKNQINQFFESHNCSAKLLDGSGNGEGGGALTNVASLFGKYNVASVGRANYGLSVKFVDRQGEIVPLGKSGNFCFAGKNVMLGYYADAQATAKVKYKDADGIEWFHTDTLGHMDKDGWIYFDGRERRFFITFDEKGSPFKVYCDHAQETIKQCPEIQACAVVQCSNKQRSFVPVAFLVVQNGISFAQACNGAKEICRTSLQTCAQPVKYIEAEQIPHTRAGKIDYRSLEQFAEKFANEKQDTKAI